MEGETEVMRVEELIERIAKLIYDKSLVSWPRLGPWERLWPEVKEHYRDLAREILKILDKYYSPT